MPTCWNTVLEIRKIYLISLEMSVPAAQVANEQAGYYKETVCDTVMHEILIRMGVSSQFSQLQKAPPPTSLQPDDVVGLQEPVNGPAELCCPDQTYHCF